MSRLGALAAALVLSLAGAGCPGRSIDPLTGLSCRIPIEKQTCAALPGGFRLEDCTLYRRPTDAVGVPYGQGWGRRESPDGGVAIADPCGEAIALQGLRTAQDPGATPTLLCNAPDERSCPSERPGTAYRCAFRPDGLAAVVGGGSTAASLAANGSNVAAVWRATLDGVHEARWAWLDATLLPTPGGALSEDAAESCNSGQIEGYSRVAAVTALGPPQLRPGGIGEFLAVGLCNYASRDEMLRVQFNGSGASARALCLDLGNGVREIDFATDRKGSQLIALAVRCNEGGAVSPGGCLSSNLLVLQREQLDVRCNRPDLLPVQIRGAPAAPWVDAVPVTFGLAGQESTPLLVGSALSVNGFDLPQVATNFFSGEAYLGTATALAGRTPATAGGHNAAVVSTLDPLGTLVGIRYTNRGGSVRISRDQLVFADDPAYYPVPDGAVSVAIDPTSTTGESYAVCYTSVAPGCAVTASTVEVDNGLPGTPVSFGCFGSDDGPCGLTAGRLAEGQSAGRYVALAISGGQPLVAVSGGAKGWDQSRLNGFDRGPLGRITDIQLVATGKGNHVAVLEDDAGQVVALLLQIRDGAPPQMVRSLATLSPEEYLERPRLTAEGEAAFLTYAGPASAPGLHRRQITPLDVDTVLPIENARRGTTLLQADGQVAVVYGGPYRGQTATPGMALAESAWYRSSPGAAPLRLLPPDPIAASSPSLLATDSGVRVGFGPAAVLGEAGVRISRLPATSDERPEVQTVTSRGNVQGVALAEVASLPGQGLVLYTTSDSASPFLATFPIAPAAPPLPVTGGEGVAVPLVGVGPGELSAPAIVPLEPGILGLSVCRQEGARRERLLVPTDLQGRPLGPPLVIGTQVEGAEGQPVLPCPPAPLAWHGRRLLASAVDGNGRVLVRELACLEQPTDAPAPEVPLPDGGIDSPINDGPAGPDGDAALSPDGGDGGPRPLGASCLENADCGDSILFDCLDEARWSTPGGYCSKICRLDDPLACGPGAVCATTACQLGFCEARCVATCESDDECRPGYVCHPGGFAGIFDLGSARACTPGNRAARTGDPCTANSQCAPGRGACLTDQDGGYCSERCDPSLPDSCGADGVCADFASLPPGGLCLARCASSGDCRPGQSCAPAQSAQGATPEVCLPGDPSAELGGPCQTIDDCPPGMGFCLAADLGGPPNGLCVDYCQPGVDCGAGNHCVALGYNWCIKGCTPGGSDCRDGQACAESFLGLPAPGPVCTPGQPTPVPIGQPCSTTSDCAAGQGCTQWGTCALYCAPIAPGIACPAGSVCASGVCLPGCTSTLDCDQGDTGLAISCSARFYGATIAGNRKACVPHDAEARIGGPCQSIADCPAGGFCYLEDLMTRLEFRNGRCGDTCRPGTSDCGEGITCVGGTAGGGLCYPACTTDADCRADEGYYCAFDGVYTTCNP